MTSNSNMLHFTHLNAPHPIKTLQNLKTYSFSCDYEQEFKLYVNK